MAFRRAPQPDDSVDVVPAEVFYNGLDIAARIFASVLRRNVDIDIDE
jgi:hypothetical protein